MATRLLFTLILLCAGPAAAQHGTGELRGVVTDLEGDPLPGANIVVQGPALPARMGAITDAEGAYRVRPLPEGLYEITASYIGHKTETRKGVRVQTGQVLRVNFALATEAILQDQFVVSASRRQEKALDAPASVAVADAGEIRNRPVLSVAEHIRDLPAVDMARTGLTQSNTVVRGFNNVFSGALLVLVDNRIARVPSLRVNVQNLIPVDNDDIERIEVVLGPGSALYGPNSANGVMNILTRSPIGSEGTSVSAFGGERSLRRFSFRHAGSSQGKVGFKISGQYYAGTDWEYVDPEEVRLRGSNPRNYDASRTATEFRLDLRPQDDFTAIFSAGYTQSDHIEMTGLGAAQAENWGFLSLQTRLRYKDWFAQVFYNRSDAGDTRLLRSNNPIVDKSTLTVFQAQHTAQLAERQRFTYGVDALFTRPKTGGTISGANENSDDINEYGFYVQSESALHERLDLVLAARFDDHNHIENPVFSPRAALVVKPDPLQTLRFTYNRAFGTPTSNNLFLDLVASPDAFGLGANFQPSLGFSPAIDIRTQGTTRGFTFNRDANGLPTFRSPFAPVAGLPVEQQIPLHDPQFTNVMWNIGRGAVMNAFVPSLKQLATGLIAGQMLAAGMPEDQALAAAAQQADALAVAFENTVPKALPGLRNTLRTLNTETQSFDPVASLETAVTDIARFKPTITETFEAGYKGVIQNRFILAADVYRTRSNSSTTGKTAHSTPAASQTGSWPPTPRPSRPSSSAIPSSASRGSGTCASHGASAWASRPGATGSSPTRPGASSPARTRSAGRAAPSSEPARPSVTTPETATSTARAASWRSFWSNTAPAGGAPSAAARSATNTGTFFLYIAPGCSPTGQTSPSPLAASPSTRSPCWAAAAPCAACPGPASAARAGC